MRRELCTRHNDLYDTVRMNRCQEGGRAQPYCRKSDPGFIPVCGESWAYPKAVAQDLPLLAGSSPSALRIARFKPSGQDVPPERLLWGGEVSRGGTRIRPIPVGGERRLPGRSVVLLGENRTLQRAAARCLEVIVTSGQQANQHCSPRAAILGSATASVLPR
jgi:hypothetical protein